ncbi:MAG: membrane protein insertase YidC, partial [Thermodesulfovibrionales bacterium]|nr:membrane protein insertase YidC [Thermodesulfovibrionales bacterium]
MDKRTLIAIILSIAILVGYQYFFIKPVPPKPVTEQAKTAQGEEKKQEAVKPVSVLPSMPAVPSEEKEIKVETELYSATLSSTGATIKKWELKKHKDKDGLAVLLQKERGAVPPLAVGPQNNFSLSKVNFSVSGRDINLTKGTNISSVVFEYANPEYSIRRTYTFYND